MVRPEDGSAAHGHEEQQETAHDAERMAEVLQEQAGPVLMACLVLNRASFAQNVENSHLCAVVPSAAGQGGAGAGAWRGGRHMGDVGGYGGKAAGGERQGAWWWWVGSSL